jgi:hypothetical protein
MGIWRELRTLAERGGCQTCGRFASARFGCSSRQLRRPRWAGWKFGPLDCPGLCFTPRIDGMNAQFSLNIVEEVYPTKRRCDEQLGRETVRLLSSRRVRTEEEMKRIVDELREGVELATVRAVVNMLEGARRLLPQTAGPSQASPRTARFVRRASLEFSSVHPQTFSLLRLRRPILQPIAYA